MQSRVFAILAVAIVFSTVSFAYGPYVIRRPVSPSAPWELCQIDLETGVLDVIGPTGAIGPLAVISLVYYPDGFLYAIFDSPTSLFRIDPATGESTLVGPLAIDFPGGPCPDLAVDDSGVMWLLMDRELFQIEPATGAVTLHCSLQDEVTLMGLAFNAGNSYTVLGWPDTPVSLECNLNGVVVNVGPSGDVFWLANGPGNQLYGLAEFSDWYSGHSWSILYRLDATTGDKELVEFDGSLDALFRGLAFPPYRQQPPGQAIPFLGPSMVALFCFALALTGVFVIKIRRI